MPWNPEIYDQFKSIRYLPFFDLVDLISADHLQNGVDVGCGTGEQTSLLSKRFEHCSFTGLDSSEEMLAKSKVFGNDRLHYELMSIEAFAASTSTWDLIFSNAALQWSDDHEQLFPKLIGKLNEQGQLAVQMPFQKENVLNKILLDMVTEQPFAALLKGYRRDSPLLEIDDYARILFACGLKDLNISMKVYPIIAASETELYDFISGSALIPYMERLSAGEQELLKQEFLKRIKKQFHSFPAIYSFKRILLYGVKK